MLSQLAESGILGILLVVSFVAIYRLFKIILLEKDKRIEDAQKTRESISAPLEAMQKSVDLLSSRIDNFIQQNGKN